MTGAIGARLLTDVADDATRHKYWRYNHPQAIADVVSEQLIGDRIYDYNSGQRAAIQLAAVGAPVAASLGVYDLTNPGELGRAKGFAQNYAAEGSEDRRETTNPAAEAVERFGLGRRGRPLKFDTAQQDIPDLTKERYKNYMNFLYNDKSSGTVPAAAIGSLGTAGALALAGNRKRNIAAGGAIGGAIGAGLGSLGAIKLTRENLEGKPEALVAGFPVGLEAVGALVGGSLAVRGASNRDVGQEVIPGGIGPSQSRARTVKDTSENIPGPMPKDKTVYKQGQKAVKRNEGSAGRTGQRVDKYLPRARTVIGLGAAGAAGGILAGKLANRLIASTGQSDLPTTQEYGVS